MANTRQPWHQQLREAVGEMIQGPEPRRRIERQLSRLAEAYIEGPFERPPDQVITELRELSGYDTIELINRIEGWEDFYGYAVDTEAERRRAIRENKRAWRRDPLTDWIVQMWTNFGMGENIEIEPKNKELQGLFDEFWAADRNKNIVSQDALHDHSNSLIVKGEFYWAMYYDMDGLPTISVIDGEEISQVITDPENSRNPVLYKRSWTDAKGVRQELYYLNHLIAMQETPVAIKELQQKGGTAKFLEREGAETRSALARTLASLDSGYKLAHADRKQTFVCLIPCVHNRKGELRGWPLMAAGVYWAKAHKDFRENRASAAALVASIVAKLKIRGGSRAIDAWKAAFGTSIETGSVPYETNPPTGYASTFLENENMEYSKLPLSTAASDAREDGNALLLMAGLAGRVFPHWLGAGDAFRLATATSMEAPMLRNWTRYQSFWSAQFRSIVRMVAWGYEVWDRQSFDTYETEVSTDRLVEIDLAMVSRGLSFMANNALRAFVELGVISYPVANKLLAALWRQILMALNVPNVDELAGDIAFAVGIKEPEEESGEPGDDTDDQGATGGETPRGVETGR